MSTTRILSGTAALLLTLAAGCDGESGEAQGGASSTGTSTGGGGAGGQGAGGQSTGGAGGGSGCTPEEVAACDDQDPCSGDTCEGGACAHFPSPAGATCAPEMVCTAEGQCIPASAAWAAHFTGVDGFGGIAVDGAGSMVLAGTFGSVADLGGAPLTSAGNSDVFLVRLDPLGNHVWSKQFGDDQWQQANGVAIDPSGAVVIAGDFWGDLDLGGGVLPCHGSPGSPVGFVAKLDPKGDHLWSKCLSEDGQDQTLGLAVGAAGEITITGYYVGTLDLGSGPMTPLGAGPDVFVARLGPDGAPVWGRSFHLGTQDARDIAVDGAGNVYVSGDFQDSIQEGGTVHLAAPGFNTFVMRLDASGLPLWARSFGDATKQSAWSIAAGAAGELFVTGSFFGTIDLGLGPLASAGAGDIFAAKLDPAGDTLWSSRFGGPGNDWAYDIAADAAGAPILAGSFQSSIDLGGGALVSAGSDDVFVVKLDADGQHLYSTRYGDVAAQSALRVSAAGPSDALIFGRFAGSVDFGGGPITSGGPADAFVGRVAP